MFTTTLITRFAKTCAALSVAASTILAASAAHAADLTIVVNNVQQDAGQVMLGLFNQAEGFPKTISQSTLALAKERNPSGQVRMVFKGLPPGTYAATAYHDIDGNSKLNTNLMGMPTEPYGFSNNARGNFGPPSFKDAAVTLGEQDLVIEITMQ